MRTLCATTSSRRSTPDGLASRLTNQPRGWLAGFTCKRAAYACYLLARVCSSKSHNATGSNCASVEEAHCSRWFSLFPAQIKPAQVIRAAALGNRLLRVRAGRLTAHRIGDNNSADCGARNTRSTRATGSSDAAQRVNYRSQTRRSRSGAVVILCESARASAAASRASSATTMSAQLAAASYRNERSTRSSATIDRRQVEPASTELCAACGNSQSQCAVLCGGGRYILRPNARGHFLRSNGVFVVRVLYGVLSERTTFAWAHFLRAY